MCAHTLIYTCLQACMHALCIRNVDVIVHRCSCSWCACMCTYVHVSSCIRPSSHQSVHVSIQRRMHAHSTTTLRRTCICSSTYMHACRNALMQCDHSPAHSHCFTPFHSTPPHTSRSTLPHATPCTQATPLALALHSSHSLLALHPGALLPSSSLTHSHLRSLPHSPSHPLTTNFRISRCCCR